MKDIDGVTHYAYDERLVQGAGDRFVPGAAITFRALDGTVLTAREIGSPHAAIPAPVVSPDSLTPSVYLPAIKVTYDVGAGEFTVSSDDAPDLAQDAGAARVAAEEARDATLTLRDDALALVDDLKGEDDPFTQYVLGVGSVRVKHAYGTSLPAASSMPGTIFTVIPSLP